MRKEREFIQSLKIGDLIEFENNVGKHKFKVKEIGNGTSGEHAKGDGAMISEYGLEKGLFKELKVNGKSIK